MADGIQLDPHDPAGLLAAIDALPGGEQLRDAVARAQAPAHLVGGAVRDLLLGRPPRELDVTVDGDPAPLISALGGAETAHERFGTATLTLPGGQLIDIARCRAETYAAPGALPEVEPAPLAIDLHRRDVTLNAIAIDLRSGALAHAPLALEDLDAHLLRVLHPASFTDDPTRLWRLARYEVRLGADWEPVTALLARAAIDAGAPSTVSAERLGNELRLALREPDPYGALAAAARLGLGPRLELDAERLHHAEQLGAGLAPHADLVLAAVASDDPQLRAQLGSRHELSVIDAALLLRGPTAAGRRPEPLAPGAPGSQLALRFDGLPLAAVAAAPDQGAAVRWLSELRHRTLQIDGDDLLAAGVAVGPAIGRGLRAAREALLDGRVDPADRDGQLSIAAAAAASADATP